MEVATKWKTDAADAELVGLTLAGDSEAFDVLVERYQRAVYAVAFGVLSDSEAARDVLQDTFLSAYCSLSRLTDPSKFSAWVYAIARNRASGYYRSRRRKHAVEIPLDSIEQTIAPRKDHLAETVHSALSSLTEYQVDAVTLHYMEGYRRAALPTEEEALQSGSDLRTMRGRLFDPSFGGRTTYRISPGDEAGFLFTFFFRYIDGSGRLLEERLEPVFVDLNGTVSSDAVADRQRFLEPPLRRNLRDDSILASRYRSHWEGALSQARCEVIQRFDAHLERLRTERRILGDREWARLETWLKAREDFLRRKSKTESQPGLAYSSW